MSDTIMMYLGGLLLAAAVEKSGLHKRIAWKVLLLLGTSLKWLMLGFLLVTMFFSMWVTNTAATAMMVPIVDAVVMELDSANPEDNQPELRKQGKPRLSHVINRYVEHQHLFGNRRYPPF
ncbi:SLC13A5 [Cordylochernes scorpioides]|uniref:SLC13A5 n=1 Tax=Cordylochernes scorpioides TaxID=51811 RepID=A0ABY6JYL7_9ARAC|nr:SLC13A5 [Cordylochernes scorpioides]